MKNRPFITTLLLLVMISASSITMAESVDFTLPDLNGNQRSLSEFRGKWVLVNYWATWCPPCLAEMPDLELFHNRHKDKDAVVVGVNMESMGPALLKAFVEEQFISYPMLQGEPGDRTELGAVPALPTSYLVSPKGEIVARQVGAVSGEMVESFIKSHKN